MIRSSGGASGESPGTIKIIGIGQSLRGDDAAGLAAVRLWQETYDHSADGSYLQVELLELPGISLLNHLEGASFVILVDGVRSRAEPGTIHLLSPDDLDAFTSGAGSAHGWGVAETLSLGKQVIPAAMPVKIMIVGIEAGDLSLGEKLNPEVVKALPEAARLIELLVADIAQSPSSPRISPR